MSLLITQTENNNKKSPSHSQMYLFCLFLYIENGEVLEDPNKNVV